MGRSRTYRSLEKGPEPKVGQDLLELLEVIVRLSVGGIRAGLGGDDPDRTA